MNPSYASLLLRMATLILLVAFGMLLYYGSQMLAR
jgi:hypothetical protein